MAETDLLKPIVAQEKWHPYFKLLISKPALASARDMIREVWRAFPNPDDHFEREFQTMGLDARIWELCVFAVCHFTGFVVTRPFDTPDFLIERDGISAWVEVTTANPSQKFPVRERESAEEIFHHMNDYLPIRLGNALTGKLDKKYWNLPHVAGRPLVIALEDFSENDPFRVDPGSIFRYLFGLDARVISLPGDPVRIEYAKVTEHLHEGKSIPSGFFDLPEDT